MTFSISWVFWGRPHNRSPTSWDPYQSPSFVETPKSSFFAQGDFLARTDGLREEKYDVQSCNSEDMA